MACLRSTTFLLPYDLEILENDLGDPSISAALASSGRNC